MWTRVLLTAAVAVAVVLARSSSIYNYESDTLSHKMSGIPGKAVTGGYSWTAPNGQQFSVNYIADEQGYRVVNSHNSFPKTERFPRQHSAKPVNEVQSYSAAETTALRVPEIPKLQSFSRTQKSFAAPTFASQDKSALARSHFGLSSSSGADTIPKITTRRPVTVIFFNTTPKPTTTYKPVVPDNKIYHPHQVKETVVPESAPAPVPVPVVAKVLAEKTLDVAPKSEKSVVSESKASKTEVTPAEAKAEAEAEGAEAEGAEAEGAEAEGAEAEAEGEEGGEGEEEGAEGAEEEGEGAEEEESESNSEAEEW